MIAVGEVRNLHDAKRFCLQRGFRVERAEMHMIMLMLAETEVAELWAYFQERNGILVGELGC